MKILIVYASRNGYTSRFVEELSPMLSGDVTYCDVMHEEPISPEGFDWVIIGSPIYMGNPLACVRKYAQQYQNELLHTHLALFISCLLLDQAAPQLKKAFSQELFEAARCRAFAGGELDKEKLNILEKLVARMATSSPEHDNITTHMTQTALTQLTSAIVKEDDA